MNKQELVPLIEKLYLAIEQRLPAYLLNPINAKNSGGNLAVCIIDREGNMYGKMYGSDKIAQRRFFKIAWTKASQVWITGLKTGEFEKLVYAGKLDENTFGISKPDLIGWDGGQPITIDNETVLSVGCSGLQGIHDLEIVIEALKDVRSEEKHR